MTGEQARQFLEVPGGTQFLEYFNELPQPLRVPDLPGHFRSLGLPEFQPPVEVGDRMSFLLAPIFYREGRVGSIHLAVKEGGQEFAPEDEETLVMFASQAAMVIANACRYWDERQARMRLETLINTSPVGVVIFDAKTGAPVSFNREASRIVHGLLERGQSPEQLLGVVTCVRADGREVSLEELPMVQLLSPDEPVRAEEIVLKGPRRSKRNRAAQCIAHPL